MDWNAIVGLVALGVGTIFGLIGWIVRSVDRRLDALEEKEDDNSKELEWLKGSLGINDRPRH